MSTQEVNAAVNTARQAVGRLATTPLEKAKMDVALAAVEVQAQGVIQQELKNLIAVVNTPAMRGSQNDAIRRIEQLLRLQQH